MPSALGGLNLNVNCATPTPGVRGLFDVRLPLRVRLVEGPDEIFVRGFFLSLLDL